MTKCCAGIYILCSIILFCSKNAISHFDEAYSTRTSETTKLLNWQALYVDDSLTIDKVSIPGTHDSASLHGGPIVQTQTKSITSQLEAGIRFFDIRLRHIENVMAIHHGMVYQNIMFGDILNQMSSFLKSYPSEFLIVRVKEEYDAIDNTRTFEETFIDYMDRYSDIIYIPKNDKTFPTVAEMRGKLIFLDQIPRSTSKTLGIKYSSNFDIQDYYSLGSNWDLYNKWTKVKNQLVSANEKKSKIINYLSGSTGSFPYFVASGHSSQGMGDPRLLTGATTPGWSYLYPDFPRVSCFIGICSIAFEGTNILARDWIQENDPSYTGIVAGDFMGSSLIYEIVKTNDRSPKYSYR